MQIINRTPYAMERGVIFDRHGNETLLVIVKGSFEFGPGESTLADEQAPVTIADEYWGDPVKSSIRIATDMLPLRPSTGVTLSGHAICPGGRVGRMKVGLKVGDVQQAAEVYGDRLGFRNVNRPEPFQRMPLTWENAFGGFDTSPEKEKHHDALADNPVGKGFMARHTRIDPDQVPLPNIEDARQPLSQPQGTASAVGFGPVAPAWEARRRYAGTYDDRWQKERCPLLPDDFDERFLQAAPAALTARDYLVGNEECVVLGMTEEGRVDFRLDAPPPTIGVRFARAGVRSQPRLESLHFDTDARRYFVTWKSMLNIQGKVEQLKNIEARILG